MVGTPGRHACQRRAHRLSPQSSAHCDRTGRTKCPRANCPFPSAAARRPMTSGTGPMRRNPRKRTSHGLPHARAHPVRLHDLVPHRLSGADDRARQLPRGARRRCGCCTRTQVYLDLYHFWLKVFAVAFGMGVVSGIVMAYQFGTNWSEFSRFAGGVTGPLLAYEVLTAFFLEAGFLGVMLFGLNRVGPGPALHVDRRGGDRHADLGDLDPRVQQLDAHAAGPRDHRRPRGAGRLAAGDLQSVVPVPARAHGDGRLPRDRAGGRRQRRPGTCCAAATTRRCARCCRWRCGWCSSPRRSRR